MKRLIAFLLAISFLCVPAFSATITTAQNGNWSDTATWNGGSVPAEGDEAQISHTVTLDDAAGTDPGDGSRLVIVGDDSGDGIVVASGGKLQYTSSQTKDMELRVKGNLQVNSGGEFEVGTVANPITSTDFVLALNYSDTQAIGEFDIDVDGTIELQGKVYTYWYTNNTAITAGDKSFTTADSTGWSVGDEIVVGATENYGQSEKFTISGISGTTIYVDENGDGTGAGGAGYVFAYNHSSGGLVVLLSRTIQVRSYDSSYDADCDFEGATSFDIDWVRFKNLSNSANRNGVNLPNGSTVTHIVYDSFDYCAHAHVSGVDQIYSEDCVYYNAGILWYFAVYDNTVVYTDCIMIDTSLGNCKGAEFDNLIAIDYSSNWVEFPYNMVFKNSTFYAISTLVRARNATKVSFYTCDMDNFAGVSTAVYNYNNETADTLWVDCDFDNTPTSVATYGSQHRIINYNNTVGSNILIKKSGDVQSGTYASITGRGGSGNCLVFNPKNSGASTTPLCYEMEIPVTSGQAFDFTYYAKLSAADANSSLHVSVDIIGCGIEDLDNEASSLSESDWNQETISVSAPSRDGFVKVHINVWDTDASALDVYIDDVAVSAGGNVNTGNLERWGEDFTPIFDATGTGSGSSEHSYGFVN